MRATAHLLWALMALAACTDVRDGSVESSRTTAASSPPASAGRRLNDQETSASASAAAREILRQHGQAPIGTEIPFEVDGRRYVAVIEQHYAPPGERGRPPGLHKGVTLYEPAQR